MADYTSIEIQAAVEKIIRSSIRKPYGVLGSRDVTTSFDDLQEAAAGVFALNANAPYYTVFLGTERLTERTGSLEEVTVAFIEAVENLNRRVKPIDNLAPLENARVALLGLETAAATRTGSFADTTDLAAYKRFEVNTRRFLEESSTNIRKGGAVVPTPLESRSLIAGYVVDLKTQRQQIINRAGHLFLAIEDFDSLELPAVLASGVSSRARQVLDDRITELEGLSPHGRLEVIRDVTLDVLASRAAVENVTSLSETTTFASIEGEGRAFADADHPATSATLLCDIDGPYPIYLGADELYLTMDGAHQLLVPLGGSFLATLRGSSPPAGTYDIQAGINDRLEINVTGQPTVVVSPITPGLRTVEQIVVDINAAIGAQPIVATTEFTQLRFLGTADITNTSPTTADFESNTGTTWEQLNVREGDEVRVKDSASANDGSVYTVDVGGIVGTTLSCTLVTGVAPVTELIIGIEIGVIKLVTISPLPGTERDHLVGRWKIEIPATVTNTATDELGFQRGIFSNSRSSPATDIVTQVNQAAGAAILGDPKLQATEEFTGVLFDGLGRSDAGNATKLIAYDFRGRGDTAGGGPAGVVFATTGAASAGVSPGDILVVRETIIQADVGAYGAVTAVDDVSVTVTLDRAISADSDVLVEMGPDITLATAYLDLEVTGGAGGQDATYTLAVDGQDPNVPFEFTVESPIPANKGLGGQPALFSIRLGYRRPRFASLDTTLATQVQVNDTFGSNPAASEFFSALPASDVGETTWFSIPEDPQTLSVGDILEFYEATPSVASQSFTIAALELPSFLLQVVEPGMSTAQANIQMGLTIPSPYAKVRLVKKNNYQALKDQLEVWLDLDPLQTAWERELDRLVAIVNASANPTLAEINTLKLHLQALLGIVTIQGAVSVSQPTDETLEAILATYEVPLEDDVDTMVDTFLARGSDRGIDLLLQGRFRTFFGLTLEGMTYAGAVRELIREVAREDLPVRKTDRSAKHEDESVIGVFEDIDYEFDDSDLGGFEDLEIPGSFDEKNYGGR